MFWRCGSDQSNLFVGQLPSTSFDTAQLSVVGMLKILRMRAPFEIFCSVICLDAVLVVRLIQATINRWWIQESPSDQLVDVRPLAVFRSSAESDLEIAGPGGERFEEPTARAAVVAPDSSKVRYLVEVLPPQNRSPFFICNMHRKAHYSSAWSTTA